ncbi:reverse transcriptase domain-containing protein [Tanacetum coccineum]
MLAIFHDMIEESVKVFMDDFSVFGNSFNKCLNNLDKMLQHCKDAHLVLNWEKCHFMVKEGIVRGHKVSGTGLEVDKAKINVISKLPPPANIKGVRSFLGHAGFYRRFIKDFSKIARPLTKLLEKDTLFEFDDECRKAFELLKEKLTCAPMIVSLNWNLSFKFMCDASDFAVGAVLEFDIEIKDKKGTKNIASDHLSRIDNDETSDDSEVDDNFPRETLMEINTKDEPWFADFANYLVGSLEDIPSSNQTKIMYLYTLEIKIQEKIKSQAEKCKYSRRKREIKSFTFSRMETEEVSERYITPCFVEGLDAYDGETNLEYEKNMISNEFAVKLCFENEGIIDFRNGILAIYPDLITLNDDSNNEFDDLLASIDVTDLPPLDITDMPPFICNMGKSARNKKQPLKNYKMIYNAEGQSLAINWPITQEELSKEELEKDLYERILILSEKIRRIDLYPSVVFGECRHGYAVSSLMDMAYWSSE